METAPLLPQPDFEVAATAFNDYASQTQLLPNLPAVRQGNDILGLLQRLETSLRDLRNEMNRGFDLQKTRRVQRFLSTLPIHIVLPTNTLVYIYSGNATTIAESETRT